MRHHVLSVLAATFALAQALSGVPAVAGPPAAATQSTEVRGVTVKVTPRNVAADAPVWVLGIVLETHSQELADDLLKTTVLVTDDGRQIQPSAWKGAAAGGHHREGTLEFAAPKPAPQAYELRMQRPGEAQARIFRFTR